MAPPIRIAVQIFIKDKYNHKLVEILESTSVLIEAVEQCIRDFDDNLKIVARRENRYNKIYYEDIERRLTKKKENWKIVAIAQISSNKT